MWIGSKYPTGESQTTKKGEGEKKIESDTI